MAPNPHHLAASRTECVVLWVRDVAPSLCNPGTAESQALGGRSEAEWSQERMQTKGQSVKEEPVVSYSPDNLLLRCPIQRGLT